MNPGQWTASETDGRTTFFAHALSLTALHGPGPWPGGGNPLPDEPSTQHELSSTALDGIRTHHGGGADESPPVDTLINAITEVLASPDPAATAALHDRLAEHRALDVADDLVRGLRGIPAVDLRALALALIEHGTRRNAVALGIVMLGIAGDARDEELLLLLGTLEDLTLYAVVALANTQSDRDQAIHRLAQRVNGWGRIHAVERLRGTNDPEIKAWLLRGGFRNSILDQYLAHIAATTGDLHAALLAPEVDTELLHGAAGIFDALTDLHGPTWDIRNYEDALPCLTRFGELIGAVPPNLTYISTAQGIHDVLKDPPSDTNWPETELSRVLGQFSALLARPDWSQHVRAMLDHPPAISDFRRALACSDAVGINALPHALTRLRQPPHDSYTWHWAITHSPESLHGALVRLAGEILPLDEMMSGPDPERIIGSSDEESVLDYVLSYLGESDVPEADLLPLIRTALCTSGLRLRGFALRTLDNRYGPDLPAVARSWVHAAAAVEPDDDLRARFTDLLKRTEATGEK